MPPKEKKDKPPEEGGGGELQPPSPADGASSAWDKAKADPKPYKPPVGQKIPNFTPERPKAVPIPNFTPGQNLEFTDVLNRGAGPEGGGGGSMDQLYTGEELPSGPSQGMPEVYPNAEQRNAYAADVPDPSLPAPPRRPIVGPEESRRIFQSHSAEGQALADLSDMYKAKIAEATAPAITPGPTEPTESVKGQLQSAQAGAYHGRKVVHGVPEAARDYSQEEMDQLLLTDPRAHAQIMASHHDNLVKKIVANEQEAARARLEAKGIVVPSTPQGGQAHETQVAAPTHVAQAASSHPGGGSPSATPSHAPAARPSGDFVGPKAPVSEARKVDITGFDPTGAAAKVMSASATRTPTPEDVADQRRAAAAKVEARGQVGKDPSTGGVLDFVPDFASGVANRMEGMGALTNPMTAPQAVYKMITGVPDAAGKAGAETGKFIDSPSRYLNQVDPHAVAKAGGGLAVDAAMAGAGGARGGLLGSEGVTEGMGNWSAKAPKEAYPVGEVPYAPRTAPPFVEDLGSVGPKAKAAPKASAAEAPPSAPPKTPSARDAQTGGNSHLLGEMEKNVPRPKPRPNPGGEAIAKAGGKQKVLDFAHGQQAQKEAAGMAKAMAEKPAPGPGSLKGKESPKALPPPPAFNSQKGVSRKFQEAVAASKNPPSKGSKGKATPMGGDAPSGSARPAGPAGSSKPKPELSGTSVGQKELPAPKKAKSMSSSSNKEGRPQGPVQAPTKMTVTETPKKSWIDRFKNRGK